MERHHHVDAFMVFTVVSIMVLWKVLGQASAVQFHTNPLARAWGWLTS